VCEIRTLLPPAESLITFITKTNNMFILAKLVFKSYMPKELEPGMWFVSKHKDVVYGNVYEYLRVHQLQKVPQDMESYVVANGAPVEPYIIQPMKNADDVEEILAFPNQIGWWDDGAHSDDIEDLSVAILNSNIYGEDGENGAIALYVDDYVRKPILIEGKVVIRDSYEVDEGHDENDNEREEDWDDMDDNDHDDYNENYYEDHNTE
jgi:hypothetical protein